MPAAAAAVAAALVWLLALVVASTAQAPPALNYQVMHASTRQSTAPPSPKRLRTAPQKDASAIRIDASVSLSRLAPTPKGPADSPADCRREKIVDPVSDGTAAHYQVDNSTARAALAKLPSIRDVPGAPALEYGKFKAMSDFDCILDPELEQLVHAPGTRTRVYMFYHNNRTEFVARRFAFCKDWIVPYFLKRSPYMESQVYRDLYLPNAAELEREVDFVLACTYRHAIIGVDNHLTHQLTNGRLKELIRGALYNSSDVVPLETEPHVPVLYSLRHSHGMNGIRAWNFLLIKMNFDTAALESCTHIMGFWRSSFVIRPVALTKLSQLMVTAMDLVDTDARLISVFKKDAKYEGGDPVVAYQVFGTPYYQMHPFVFERLPAFFLTVVNASVPGLVPETYRRPEFANFTSFVIPRVSDE